MQQKFNALKEGFIRFAIKNNVLTFGNFVLKSGRESPYFFNLGQVYQGDALRQLGQYYASLIIERQINCQHLFGPAYKGIPLVTAVAIALAEQGIFSEISFNRKEVKDHGEGGSVVGAPLQGKITIVDDVISAGTAFREAESLVMKEGGEITTLILALNRQEKGNNQSSAIHDITKQGIEVYSIIDFSDLVAFLKCENKYSEAQRMEEYFATYGSV